MANDGGIKSPFQFVDYKIERLSLEVKPYLDLLDSHGIPGPWTIDFGIRNPIFFTSRNQYFGGVSCKVYFERQKADSTDKETVISAEGSIVGLFSVENKIEIEKHEKNLVFNQIPAILLPYLRAALTSTLAHAGFGGVIIPLVNMYSAAEGALTSVELQVQP